MKEAIGYLLISLPFLALFIFICRTEDSFKVPFIIFSIASFASSTILLGVFMING